MKYIKFLNENKWLVFILLLATTLRVYHINFQSLWLDEIYTLNVSNPDYSFKTLISEVNLREGFPYLYFIILKVLHGIFGHEAIVARSFSAFFGVLGVFYIFKLGNQLFNKKVGLIAALLLTFNEYSIFISQEARPYSFYFFATLFTFYYLIIFIKNYNLKNGLIYGISAGLLLNTNFFSFINLFSHSIIILSYLIIIPKENKFIFLKNAMISAIIAVVLFIPNYVLLIKLLNFDSQWIPKPTNESLNIIFNEFLGNSQLTLFIFFPLFLYYLFLIFIEKTIKIDYDKIIENNYVFSFSIFFPWIFVIIVVITLKSYLDTSLMITRYFISILPVFFLIFAISIYNIKNIIIQKSITFGLIILMFINLYVVKNYYNNKSKTQFREVANFIIDNNKNNEPVYTSLKYWYDFYLNNNKFSYNLIEKQSLEELIIEISKDTSKVKPFWYIDAHGRPFNLSESAKKILESNFSIENNFDGSDAWGKHFVPSKDVKKSIDISKFDLNLKNNGDIIKLNVELFENQNNNININGWAFFENQNADDTKIHVLLINESVGFISNTQKVLRADVTDYFGNKFNLDNAGFSSSLNYTNFKNGKYIVALYLINNKLEKEGLYLTDYIVEKI